MSTKAVRPSALFLINDDHAAVHTQILHMLASMGVDIYAHQEYIQYNKNFNNHQVNPPPVGMSFDFLIFEANECLNLDLLKKDGFVFESSDLISLPFGLSLVQKALIMMIRERSLDYDPNEMIIFDKDILPGLSDDSKQNQKLVSSYLHQYRHVLRKRANLMINFCREFIANDTLLNNILGSVNSKPFLVDYLIRGGQGAVLTAPWNEQEDDTPPWEVDDQNLDTVSSFDPTPDPEITENPICPLGVSGIPVS